MANVLSNLSARGISLTFDPHCGMIRNLAITDGGRVIRPLHRVPWLGEDLPPGLPPHLAGMEGDFFCAPFADGGGTAPVFHGWPANGHWQLSDTGPGRLAATLADRVQGAQVVKRLRLCDGHPFLYQSHVFIGGTGTISAANHAMASLPAGGLLSFSPKSGFRTPATAPETEPARGRSALAYPAWSPTATDFPAADGGRIDLTRYPFRAGHEDFVVATEAPDSPLGWTAVVRRGLGDAYLSLRNPRHLPATMLWQSDGGRDYPPWSGRHRACLGVEDGAAPHMLGDPGGLSLDEGLDIRHATGAVSWPSEARIIAVEISENLLRLRGEGGESRSLPFDQSHLFP